MNIMARTAIITRTKDRPVFLRRALKSVANQTHTDYIHIVVNDGGSKQTVDDMVSELEEEQRAKTKVFHREISSGAPDTIFNESIDRTDSEYFVIHDDDDTWHSEFLEYTVAHLDNHTDIGAVVVRTDKVIESVADDRLIRKKKYQWMPDVKVINLYRQCIDNQFTPIATLFRRDAYRNVGKFDDTLPVIGDWEFGIRLLMKYDADYIDPGFALANYHHRIGADNSFATHNHHYYVNKVMNKYLRQELAEGCLGVGYIMSELKYNQNWVSSIVKRALPNFVVRRLKQRIND